MPVLRAVLKANAEAAGYKSWELPELTPLLQYSNRSEMVARARPGNALLSKEEMIRLTIQNKHHLWNADYKPLKGYRDLHEIFREQMRAVAAGGEYRTEGRTVRLLTEPLPSRPITPEEWTYRMVSSLDIPWSGYNRGLVFDRIEEYRQASQEGRLREAGLENFDAEEFVEYQPMWQAKGDIADTVDEALEALSRATAGMSSEEAIAYEALNTAFIPFVYLLNLDRVDSWLGAALFEAGLLDASTFAETLKWALEDGMVLPNRLVATLREVSAISPLAGWRVLQVLRLLLPMVGGLTKGGDYVRLAVELAELYGVAVEIPAELEPTMKGATVLAKALRALAAVPARKTEEALAAREAALALLGES